VQVFHQYLGPIYRAFFLEVSMETYDYIIEGPGLHDLLPRIMRVTGMWISDFELDVVAATEEAEQLSRLKSLMQPFEMVMEVGPEVNPVVREGLPLLVRCIATSQQYTQHVPLFYCGFPAELEQAPSSLRWWVRIDPTAKANCSGIVELLHLYEPPLE